MASNIMLLLLLTFSLVNAKAMPPPESSRDEHGHAALVQRRDRDLLSRTLDGMQPDAVVSKDGSGGGQYYTTISAAIAEAPAGSKRRYVIHVRKGTYEENVEITRPNIVLVGDGAGQTIISGNRSTKTGHDMPSTATVIAKGNGFMARDLTIENTAGPDAQQAVALRSSSDRSVVYRCELKGFQDTVYAENHRQFYRECEISGTVDFVYGDATAVFQNCLLLARRPIFGQHNIITAQGRNSPGHSSGFSFQNCSVTTREDLTDVETYLGRPWRNHSHVVFMQSFLSNIVHPSGWVPWNKGVVVEQNTWTVLYGEYNNRGPGANVSQRVKWPGFHVIKDASEARMYTVDSFINGSHWLPKSRVMYKPGL